MLDTKEISDCDTKLVTFHQLCDMNSSSGFHLDGSGEEWAQAPVKDAAAHLLMEYSDDPEHVYMLIQQAIDSEFYGQLNARHIVSIVFHLEGV